MNKSYTILCLENSRSDFLLIQRELGKSKLRFHLEQVDTKQKIRACLNSNEIDLVLIDNRLPSVIGIKALEIMQEIDSNIPFIIVSGAMIEELDVNGMRLGASNCIEKDDLNRLLPAIESEVRDNELRQKERQNKKQLILTELRYKFLAESIQEVFFALDFNFRFTYWNETASKVFKKTDVIGKDIIEVFPSWTGTEMFWALSESLKTGRVKPLNFTHKLKRIEYFKGKVYPSNEGMCVLLRDVTDESITHQKLERLNNELETLLYRISHDLKGPVASVLGLLNIVNCDDSISKEQLAVMMKSNMDRLSLILSELLDITNIKTGKPQVAAFEILPCLKQVIKNLERHKGIEEVNFHLNLDEELTVHSDVVLFKSIWQNLIENSIKYRQKGSPNKVIINGQLERNNVLLSITDSGQGISAEVRLKMYQMFFRGNESSDGSGLGLYIVKNALEKLKGTIEYDTSYKHGARFLVTIPSKTTTPVLNG